MRGPHCKQCATKRGPPCKQGATITTQHFLINLFLVFGQDFTTHRNKLPKHLSKQFFALAGSIWDSRCFCPLRRSSRVTRVGAPSDSRYGTSAPSPARKNGGLRFWAVTLALRPRTALTAVNITPSVARGGFASAYEPQGATATHGDTGYGQCCPRFATIHRGAHGSLRFIVRACVDAWSPLQAGCHHYDTARSYF